MAEIALLVVFAVIVFGPEKLPEAARKLARVVAFLRRVSTDARVQIRQELGPEFDDITLADLNPKTFVQRHILSGDEVADLRQIRDEAVSAGTLARDSVDEARSVGRAAVRPPAESATAPQEGLTSAPRAVAFDPEAT